MKIASKRSSHNTFEASPVTEWLRRLFFSVLNHHLTAVGSSQARVSHVLLAGGQVFFFGDLSFWSHLAIDLAQNE